MKPVDYGFFAFPLLLLIENFEKTSALFYILVKENRGMTWLGITDFVFKFGIDTLSPICRHLNHTISRFVLKVVDVFTVKPGFQKANFDHDNNQVWVKTKRLGKDGC